MEIKARQSSRSAGLLFFHHYKIQSFPFHPDAVLQRIGGYSTLNGLLDLGDLRVKGFPVPVRMLFFIV